MTATRETRPGHRGTESKGPKVHASVFAASVKRTTVAESPYMHFAADSRFFAYVTQKRPLVGLREGVSCAVLAVHCFCSGVDQQESLDLRSGHWSI